MLASNVGFAPCGTRQGLTLRLPASTSAVTPQRVGRRVVVRATADEEAELEKRLEKLRQVKGATPYGQGKAKAAKETGGPAPVKKSAPGPKVEYDFSDEVVHFEGTPAMGDLYLNLALGTTLFWLPLTIASIGRVSFVRFRFTNKRFSVTSNAPWRKDRTEVAYAEIQDIVAVGRGWGAWGDMVVTLNNGDKVELRSLENFRELKQYVLAQRDKLAPLSPRPPTPPPGFGKAPKPKGAEVTAAELMGEPEPSTPAKGDKKGFA